MRKYGFIKYETRLLNDHRFFNLSELEQLTWLKLLPLFSITNNKIPNDMTVVKAYLRTKRGEDEIRLTLDRLKEVFPKFKCNKHFFFYKGWKKQFQKIPPLTTVDIEVDIDKDKDIDKRLLTHFKDRHYELAGVPYKPSFGKDNRLLANLVKLYGEKDTVELMDEFFDTAKNPKEWWADKLSIGVFNSVINQLIGKLRKK